MSKTVPLTAEEWLQIRATVADALKVAGSGQQAHTRSAIAENLLTLGYIDVHYLKDEIDKDDRPGDHDIEGVDL